MGVFDYSIRRRVAALEARVVTWMDEGHVPTVGAIHVYAIVTPLG